MASYSNKRIQNYINKLIDGISNFDDVAGEKLAKNLRVEAHETFKKGESNWFYKYHGDFKKKEVTYYDKAKKQVIADHPAANRINFGQARDIVIRPKNGKALKYEAHKGEFWNSAYEKIPKSSFPARHFAERAIEDTIQDLQKNISEGKLK